MAAVGIASRFMLAKQRRKQLRHFFRTYFNCEYARFLLWKMPRLSVVACPHDGVFISSREDRYGANSIPWLNAIAVARVRNLPLYHHCSIDCFRFRDTVVHRLLVKNSIRARHCERCDLNGRDGWFYGQHKALLQYTDGNPLPDVIAESGLKQELFSYFRAAAEARGWTLPADCGEAIAVHVRLDDIKGREKPNKQGFIGEEKLVQLIVTLHAQYPHHAIRLVTSPNKTDFDICRRAIALSNVECSVSGSDDIDYDLYLMMCSDILILSRSTFGLVAALLHQGSAVFSYTTWTHFEELVGDYSPEGDNTNRSKVLTVPPWI